MADELAYALITPYSLYKSRTGGILGRLLAQSKLELQAVRMFIFSDEFLDEYGKVLCSAGTDGQTKEAWDHYLEHNLRESNLWHYAPRCMVLLFRGPGAVRRLKDEVVGSFTESPVGDTIRGTFGDYIRDENGVLHHFEPAVITGPDNATTRLHLSLLAQYSKTDGGLLTNRIEYTKPGKIETTLVLLKPREFNLATRQTGDIIDEISRTGLKIVAANLLRMSVDTAIDLYGPMAEEFTQELHGSLTQRIYSRLHDAFSFPLTMADSERIADMLCDRNAQSEYNRIVHYMTGINPEELSDTDEASLPGRVRSMALLYEGVDAVEKVRDVLAAADPTRAAISSDRSNFWRELQRHGAHASESSEQAKRQRRILGMADDQEDADHFGNVIRRYLGQ